MYHPVRALDDYSQYLSASSSPD